MDAMERYKALSTPPKDALKKILGGRLKGKTDISPQWRIEAMTQQYGECGIGWKYEVVNKWLQEGANGEIAAFADILLYTVNGHGPMGTRFWSEPIPGHGGSMFISKEKDGMYTSDEAFKMAITDALSVAMKFLGVAADIYRGFSDGVGEKTKYDPPAPKAAAKEPEKNALPWLNKDTKSATGQSAYEGAEQWMRDGNDIDDIKGRYRLSKGTETHLLSLKPKKNG